jgi:hypothetical protein
MAVVAKDCTPRGGAVGTPSSVNGIPQLVQLLTAMSQRLPQPGHSIWNVCSSTRQILGAWWPLAA